MEKQEKAVEEMTLGNPQPSIDEINGLNPQLDRGIVIDNTIIVPYQGPGRGVIRVPNPQLIEDLIRQHQGFRYIIKSSRQDSPVSNLALTCLQRNLDLPTYEEVEFFEGPPRFIELVAKVGETEIKGYGSTWHIASNNASTAMQLKIESLGDNFDKTAKVKPFESEFQKNHEFVKKLGSGGFGIVLETREKFTGERAAIKRVKLPSNKEEKENALEEVKVFANLEHSNIVSFKHYWIEDPPNGWQEKQDANNGIEDSTNAFSQSFSVDSGEDQDSNNMQIDVKPMYLYIKMELCQSDLRKWMDNNAKRDKDVISNFFIQILEGVKYLHEITNHMHRDLKPSNILFAIRGNENLLKIGDFGLTKIDKLKNFPAGGAEVEKEGDLTTYVGTELYLSPEQRKKEDYGCKVDIFSSGLIYLEMQRQMITEIERNITFGKARHGDVEEFPNKELILDMLKEDPDLRPTASDILARVRQGHISN